VSACLHWLYLGPEYGLCLVDQFVHALAKPKAGMPHGVKLLAVGTCLVVGLACVTPLLTLDASASSVAVQQPKSAGITVSPTQKVLTLSSGLLEAHSDIVLSNNTPQAVDVVMSVRDLTQIYEKGDQSFGQAGLPVGKYGLANWAVLPNGGNVTLKAGESKTVPITIQNRADLTPGGHYGAIVTSLKQGQSSGANPVSVQQNLLSFLFVTKLGGEKFGMSLKSFTLNDKKTIPKDVSIAFNSTGNVYVVPRGYVSVFDPKGVLVAKGIINTESAFVLPGTNRSFDVAVEPVAHQQSASGKYTVIASYRYDGHDNFDTVTRYTNVTAHKPVLAYVAIITGLIGLAFLLKQHRFTKRRR
jgi:hypothetical protein